MIMVLDAFFMLQAFSEGIELDARQLKYLILMGNLWVVQFQLNDLLEEKMRPYIQSMDDVLPQSVIIRSKNVENKVSLQVCSPSSHSYL